MADSLGGVAGVVFDLFGTLVPAPSRAERGKAACRLAACLYVPVARVDHALSTSWRVRHDGTLRDTAAVAGYLARACAADPATIPALAACLTDLAAPRLRADSGVLEAVRRLREAGIRVGLLTDAAANVADVWPGCELDSVVDAAVFSCRYGRLKPHPELYAAVLDRLAVSADMAVYCGDGGGAELAGARRVGMRAVRVRRRGGRAALAFGETAWTGLTIVGVEDLPALLTSGQLR